MLVAGELAVFVPIRKIDAENRLVYGTVAAEVQDNSGEVFDYESSKPYFQKWSDNAHATSGGKSHGNLRVMHTSKVAGIVSEALGFDDEAKQISCCAKVVDDDEWKKVEAGCYTGFSMGGRYVARLTKGDEKRYTADPCEISLVDKPCIPTATFDIVKADGVVVETRHFDSSVLSEDGVDVEKVAGRHGLRADDGKFTTKPTKDVSTFGGSDPTGHGNAEAKAEADTLIPGGAVLTQGDAALLFAKSDNGDSNMYVPTNDEMLPVAKALAKAATGSGDNWLGHMDAAREQIVAEKADKNDFVHKDDGCEVKDCADCAKMSKADTSKTESDPGVKSGDAPVVEDREAVKSIEEEIVTQPGTAAKKSDQPELEQGWRAKDGQFFLKKADAVAHNETLAPAAGSTVNDALAALVQKADAVISGEEPKTAEDEPELPMVVKCADFLEGAAPLRKGMNEVSRLASTLRECGSLQICCAAEAAREGDGSGVPAVILEGVAKLGEALVAMATEEVAELTARLAEPVDAIGNTPSAYSYSDSYMALAHGTLGLEKSDLDQFAAARPRDPAARPRDPAADVLAKVDAPSEDILQKMAILEQANSAYEDRLAKMADQHREESEKTAELVKTLTDKMDTILKTPRPMAPTTLMVEKADAPDGKDLLQKFSPNDLADAAIRMSHAGGGYNPFGR